VGGVPGQRKRVVWTQPLPLPGLKQVGRLVGATLNDVLMSAVAGALHVYQDEHGRDPVDLVTMVPVNVRPLDEPLPRELGNRFALVFLRFPSRDATPLGRLALSKARMDWLKASPEAALTFALISVIGRFPAAIERRVVDFFANKAIGVTTNVAGPREVRHLAGVPVTGVLGWVPGSGRHTLGFCIVTYDDAVRIGIMADESVVPDPEALLVALEDEVALLVRIGAAGPTAPSRRPRRS
jgi:WS/DGAT/MGAT family acyltransferase